MDRYRTWNGPPELQPTDWLQPISRDFPAPPNPWRGLPELKPADWNEEQIPLHLLRPPR